MKKFETTEQLISAFDNFKNSTFYDPVHLKDTEIGFSVKCKYPSGIRYKPSVTKKGEPDDVAVLWVVYSPPEGSASIADLYIKISPMSIYRSNHFDYNYDDDDSPTKESVEESRLSPKPIGIEFTNEFKYDHGKEVFIFDGKELKGIEVLNRVMESHCNTVHPIKGFSIRSKLMFQNKSSDVLGKIAAWIVALLKNVFGRTLDTNDFSVGVFSEYERTSLKKLNQDSIDLWGYKASRSVIMFFSLIVVCVTMLKYFGLIEMKYIGSFGGSELLAIIHGVFALWILDEIFPRILFKTLNFVIRMRRTTIFMRFKVK